MYLIGKRARKASQYKIDTKIKNNVLASYAKMLDENKSLIIIYICLNKATVKKMHVINNVYN